MHAEAAGAPKEFNEKPRKNGLDRKLKSKMLESNEVGKSITNEILYLRIRTSRNALTSAICS
jgi:hypothetical protein